MRLKKKVKVFIILLVVVALGVGGFFVYKKYFDNSVKEAKVIYKIKKYGYTLKDIKSLKYKKMFLELRDILKMSEVDEDKYVKKISEMFIYDFYSLNDKTAKTDVGGTDFVYDKILDNFMLNAEDTYYKYVESNIYHQRKQKLPMVNKVKINSVEKTSFKYDDEVDEEAYEVKVSWDYTSSKYDSYQKEATLVFIHDGIKLVLVELK
ncbi:MAG: hypothetical protein IJF92_06235 [Bacilli bacterium]|nr:hypothetical protein [Bacilli bacterium]